MGKLNNTPIKPLIFFHRTNKFYTIAAFIAVWILLTTGLVTLAIHSNLFHKQYQCESTTIAPIKTLTTPEPSKLIKRVSMLYNIPYSEAYEIVNVVESSTNSNTWPDKYLVLAIIAVESRFKRNADSGTGAKGLMQVLQSNQKRTDIWSNIMAGVEILRKYHDITGSKHAAIAAYNIGPAPVLKGAKNLIYVNKVLTEYAKIKGVET